MARRGKSSDHTLARRIASVLQHGRLLSKGEAEAAAFHLTDWLDELAQFNDLLQSRSWDPATAQAVLMSFVTHAPAHLAAAHRIVMGQPVTDVFEVGAVKGSGRAPRKPGAPSSEQPVRGFKR